MNAELIKALRWCGSEDERHEMCVDETYRCPMWNEDRITDECKAELMLDAADALEAADKRIAELEAQLPKEGEWVEVHDWLHIPQEERGTYRCSACGQVMKYPWNYCPNCGCRMDGETK